MIIQQNIIQDKLSEWIKIGILLFLASMIFSIAIVQMTAGLLMVIWIVKIIFAQRYKFIHTQFDLPVIIFIIIRVLSVLFSTNLSTSIPTLYKEIPFYFVFFVFTNSISVENKKYLKLMIWILIVSACIAAIYGTSKVLLGFEERATSSTSGYSTLGMFLAVIIAVTMGLGRNKEFFPSRLIWGLCVFIMCIGLLYTLNRTHWGVVGLIFLIVGIMRERWSLLFGIIIAGIAIWFVPTFAERFYQMIHFLEYTSGRNIIWQGALMILTSRPILGFGPRTFEEIFPLRNQLEDKLIASWHNDYLQVYMESGIFGLLAFLWIIVSVYYFCVKILKNKTIDSFYRDITFAIMLGMTAFFLTGLVGGFIIDPITSLLFRFLLALLALVSVKFIYKETERFEKV